MDINNILIMKWGALGDIAVASARFEDVRRAYPKAKIDLNVMAPFDQLFYEDLRFNKIISIDLRKSGGRVSGALKWLHEIRRRKYDMIIDFQSNDRSRLMMSLLHLLGSAGKYRLGHHAIFPYNYTPNCDVMSLHPFTLQQKLLESIGVSAETKHPTLHVGIDAKRRVRKLMELYDLSPGEYIILMPGSNIRGYLKRWGGEKYLLLAQKIYKSGVNKVVVVGGADEKDICHSIENSCSGDWLINLCCKTEIIDLLPLAQGARAIISNDTGTAHISAAAERPMIVVCGPTDPFRVKPIGEKVVVAQADVDCLGCYQKECSHHSCMKSLSVITVFEKLQVLLQQQ